MPVGKTFPSQPMSASPPPLPPVRTPPESPNPMPRKNTHRPLAAKAPRGLAPSNTASQPSTPSTPAAPAPVPPKVDLRKTTTTRSRPSVAGKTLIDKPRVAKVASKALVKAEKAAERAAETAALAAERLALEKTIEESAASLQREVDSIERDIASREEAYIKSTWAQGNVLRGWDGFGRRLDRSERVVTGNGSGVATGAPKHRKSRLSDRIFSLSSSTSPFRIDNPDVQIVKRGGVQKKKKKK